MKSSEKIKTTVIICTLNRPQGLKNLLGCILKQTVSPQSIVVVDQSSNNESKIVVEDFKDRLKLIGAEIHYLHPEYKSLTMARNLGVQMVCTKVTTFLDDDVEIASDYIERSLRFFLDKDAVLVGGFPWLKSQSNHQYEVPGKLWNTYRRIFGIGYTANRWTVLPSMELTFDPKTDKSIKTEYISGSNFTVLTSVVRDIGFDEFLKGYALSEDVDFSFAVAKKYSGKVWLDPTLPIVHLLEPSGRLDDDKFLKMSICHHYYLFKKHWKLSPQNLAKFTLSRLGFTLLPALQTRSVKSLAKSLCYEIMALRYIRRLIKGEFFY